MQARSLAVRLVAPLLAGVVAVACPTLAVAQDSRNQNRDCSLPPLGITPINDLAGGEYESEPGGLYPDGSNVIPPAHLDLGLASAARVVPRDEAGQPSNDGVIGFISLGVSNTAREFMTFMDVAAQEPNLAPEVKLANGAQGGAALQVWLDPGSQYWTGLDSMVSEGGLSPAQVQVAWVKMIAAVTPANPALPFPDDAIKYREDLITVMQMMADRFPNLAVAYLSSRIYAGYNNTDTPTPEPWAYQQGFGVKWVIEAQIEDDPRLDVASGAAPWMAWGPYMWADGTNPRSDGLTWACDDIRADGIHPSGEGEVKVAGLILDFLRDEPTAAWMWEDRELASPTGTLPPPTISPTTAAGDAPTTTAPSPTTTPARPATSTRPGATRPDATRPDDSRPDDSRPESAPIVSEQTDDGLLWIALAAVVALAAWGTIRFIRRPVEEGLYEPPDEAED